MKNMKDAARIVGIILLGVFVLFVALPLVVSGVIHIAVFFIKIAVVLAIAYLVLVGIRALMR